MKIIPETGQTTFLLV